MKELNTFRQFISEDKVSEDKIEKVIKGHIKKGRRSFRTRPPKESC